jgi:hypothetical protein
MWRSAALSITATIIYASCASHAQTDITTSWYPLQVGNTWEYEKESLDGDMAKPDAERWTTEETITAATAFPELAGTLITKRTKVLTDSLTPGFIPENDFAKREPPETHFLIHRACLYKLDGWDAPCARTGPTECVSALEGNSRPNPAYRSEFLRGNVPAEYCFPMAKGMTWGKVPSTSPAGEDVWEVIGLNSDSFGLRSGQTFHLSSHDGSGTSMDRWFGKGVGLLQEVIEHHGTYDEDRQRLLTATINGKTQDYHLTPARTVPLSPGDCQRSGWRHFSRADGGSFENMEDCVRYSSNRQ